MKTNIKQIQSQQEINNSLLLRKRKEELRPFLLAKHKGLTYLKFNVTLSSPIIGKDKEGNVNLLSDRVELINVFDKDIIVKQGKFTAKIPIVSNRILSID